MTNLPAQVEHGNSLPCYCERCALAEYQRNCIEARTGTLADDDERHGKFSTYINYACKCARCTAANTAYHASYITKYRATDPSTWDHGTYSTYLNRRCRCQDCKDAHADYKRDYRRRKAQGKATSR